MLQVSLMVRLKDGILLRKEVMHIRISKLLEMYPYLQSRAYYRADFEALNTIIDIGIAIDRANLSDDELNILECIFIDDLTQRQTMERLGITRNAVRYRTKQVLTKVGRAYYMPEKIVGSDKD